MVNRSSASTSNVGPNSTVVLLGTSDTKRAEIEFIEQQLHHLSCNCCFVDMALDSQLSTAPDHKTQLMKRKAAEIEHLVQERYADCSGVAFLAIGGGVGSWIAISVLKSLPLGLGKVLVSTFPYDLRPDVAFSDIVLIPSITDIQGLNPILRTALRRGALIAACLAQQETVNEMERPIVAITGLGVTQGAVRCCQELLQAKGFEVATFHANGIGSRALEHLIQTGAFSAVIDLTTHELNGILFGSVDVAEDDRLRNASERGVPQVVCPGALDILTRGSSEPLSEEEQGRPHYRHSPKFTHVRTTPQEMRHSALSLVERLRGNHGPCAVLIPQGGFSSADQPGSPMWCPEATAEFVATLRAELPESIELLELPDHINSPGFGSAVVTKLLSFIPNSIPNLWTQQNC